MDDRTRAAAVEAAHQLLSRYKAQHPGWLDDRTPIDELAFWLGIHVETFHPKDYPQGTYGFLEPGEDLVWLCRDLSETLRRFTLAHELGHVVLHRVNGQAQRLDNVDRLGMVDISGRVEASPESPPGFPAPTFEDPCQQPDVQEEVGVGSQTEQERMQETLGIGQAYDPRSERELAANIFAAELLMPLERVRTLYVTESVPANQLASIFDVSNAAMLNRLVGLLTEPVSPTPGQAQDLSALHENEGEAQPYHSRGDPCGRPGVGEGRPMGEDRLAEEGHPTPAKKHYDEFQQAAIEAPTPALIVAGPGSGKTSTLIGRTEYLIQALNVQPERILALTFSRKAAQEMEERLQAVLHGNADANATNSRGMPTVSTFHAFCADILRAYGERVGLRPDFALIDDTEGYFLLRQLTREMQLFQYRNLTAPARYFPDFLKAISRAKDELVSPEQYRNLAQRMLEQAHDEESELGAKRALEVAHIYALYEQGLRRRADTDFGGLIMLTVQLFEQFPEVLHEQQQRFLHVLVDEFQDINRASGVLLRLLAGDERRVWVVGDANQAIYAFRGASPANIASFQEDYPGAVVLPLSRNYRSRPDIVHLAEAFRWQQLEADVQKEAGQNQPARLTHPDTYVTLAVAEDISSELAGLIADMRYKLTQGYTYQDMVVLCRRRAQARKITRALVLAGLPVIETRGMLGQQHIKDLISIVLLLADTSGMGILRAAKQSEHALSQDDIEALLLAARERKCSPGELIARDEAPPTMSTEGRRSLARLARILQALFQYTPNAWSLLAQYLLIETSIIRDLLRDTDSKQNNLETTTFLGDYTAFLQLARRYDQQQQALRRQQEQEAEERGEKIAPRPRIQELARGFLDYVHVMLTLGQDGGSTQQRSADGSDAEHPDVIRVMTVHASKGLEFPVVYLPGLIQRNFPLQARSNPAPAPAGMLPGESEDASAHESGESCLFYVGVTRARDHLVLSYSERNGKQKAKPSTYLDALLAGLPPERITRLRWQADMDTQQKPSNISASIEDADDSDVLPASQPSLSFIDVVRPTTLRVSDIETYQMCPRKYLYSTIYGFRSEEGTYQLFWQATQKTLEVLQQTCVEVDQQHGQIEKPAAHMLTQEHVQKLYTQHWQDLGGHLLPFAQIYEQHGHEVTELMRRKLLESGDIHWELRPNFTVELAGRTIHVSVDRVEVPAKGDKPVKFVRTRFGKRKEKPDVGTRELLYARAYRQQHGGQSLELHFHNLSTGETLPIKLTAKKEQSLVDEVEESIQGLESNEFPAVPDAFLCPMCPFFLICPA